MKKESINRKKDSTFSTFKISGKKSSFISSGDQEQKELQDDDVSEQKRSSTSGRSYTRDEGDFSSPPTCSA